MARPTKSKAEIERLCALDPTDRMTAVRREGSHLTLETLAFLAKKAIHSGDPELAEIAGARLLKRSRPIAESASELLLPEHREGVHSEAIRDVFISLQSATGDQPTFYEERFGFAYKQRCIDAVRRRRTKLEEATIPVQDVSETGGLLDRVDLCLEIVERVDHETRQQIIAELPLRQAEAATLAWIEGREISGSGSVSEIMGISPSMVHRHLRNARQRLKSIPQFRALLDL